MRELELCLLSYLNVCVQYDLSKDKSKWQNLNENFFTREAERVDSEGRVTYTWPNMWSKIYMKKANASKLSEDD